MILLGMGLEEGIGKSLLLSRPLSRTEKNSCKRLFSKLRTTVTHKYMIYGCPAVLQCIPPNSQIKMALWEIALKEKGQS